MIAFVATAVLAAAWPPARGVVDVQVRNPNLGDPGCVLLQDATVRCWPSTFFLGQWQAENWPRPQLLARPDLTRVREFGGSDCVLLATGQVRCLKDGTFRDIGVAGAVQVATHGEVGCARLKDGGVSCWGWNRLCVLGSRADVSGCEDTGRLPPARVQGLPRLKWLAVAAGVCGLTEEGAVLCWGPHPFAAPSGSPRPDRIADVPPLARLWIGPEVALGVTTDGRLLAWKQPTYGEAARPTSVPGADKIGAKVVDASISYGFAVLVLGDGSAWLWGHQPGTLRQIPPLPPTWTDPIRRVAGVDDAVKVSTAHEHVCLVTRGGRVRCFGSNAYGELGDGSVGGEPVTVPTAVVEITEAALPDPVSRQCVATRKNRKACLREGTQCYLRGPPPPVVCAGGAYEPDRPVQPPPPQSIQSCLCTCSRQFRQLSNDQLRQHNICGNIPSAPGAPPHPPAQPTR